MIAADIKIELWPIGKLTPYDLNAKKHDKDQVARIVESIKRFGWDQPIVVDKNGVIIKGHGRRLAALELGLANVPVWVRADLTPEQANASRLADNRAGLSDIDPELMRAALAALDNNVDELLVGIFDKKEVDYMEADLGTMNVDAFVSDMDAVVDGQQADVQQKLDGLAAKRVPLAKAFGFKDIDAGDQIHITNLMAKAEAATNLSGAPALIAFFTAQKK